MEGQVEKMRAYVTRMHEGQKRQDGTTAAMHVSRVATILKAAFAEAAETPDSATLAMLQCAALGHDLLEDTPANEEEVKGIAGDKGLELIGYLTNRLGDDHPAPYVTQVTGAPEEARLIKLCDLTDNLFHASFSILGLGVPWMHSYFLPIVDPMREAIVKTSFTKYPKTGMLLIRTAQIARKHLQESIERVSATT